MKKRRSTMQDYLNSIRPRRKRASDKLRQAVLQLGHNEPRSDFNTRQEPVPTNIERISLSRAIAIRLGFPHKSRSRLRNAQAKQKDPDLNEFLRANADLWKPAPWLKYPDERSNGIVWNN